MSTPKQLRQRAQRERQRAAKLRLQADQAELRSKLWDETAKRLEGMGMASIAEARLTLNRRRGKVKGVTPEQRQGVSDKMLAGNPLPEWLEAARKAKLPSLGAIAEALGVSTSFMSQVKAGKKAMSDDKAALFERLTGYPAARWRK